MRRRVTREELLSLFVRRFRKISCPSRPWMCTLVSAPEAGAGAQTMIRGNPIGVYADSGEIFQNGVTPECARYLYDTRNREALTGSSHSTNYDCIFITPSPEGFFHSGNG